MTWALQEGDAFALLREMPDRSVDAVITDPPYGTGAWKRPNAGAGADPTAVFQREAWDTWDPSWLPDARRVSRGPVVFFCPSNQLRTVLSVDGMGPWRLLIWAKPDPRPRFGDSPAYGFEPVVAFGPLMGGGADWLEASAPRLGRDSEAVGHPHQKPLSVMQWLVGLASRPGGLILDPFAGSGSTGLAALAMRRRFQGFEQDPRTAANARRRLAAWTGQGRLEVVE